MSKQHRTKLIKSLEQQLAATDDPKIKADVSRQLTKLLFKPSRKGSSRKPEETQSLKTSALVAKWANRLSHVEPEAKRIEFSVILEAEERCKKPDGSSIDRHALFAEVFGMLSAEEHAVLNAGSAEVA